MSGVRAISPQPDRMSIFNSFRKQPDGQWVSKNKQLILCACGWKDGFRTFADGEISKTVEQHNAECQLRN